MPSHSISMSSPAPHSLSWAWRGTCAARLTRLRHWHWKRLASLEVGRHLARPAALRSHFGHHSGASSRGDLHCMIEPMIPTPVISSALSRLCLAMLAASAASTAILAQGYPQSPARNPPCPQLEGQPSALDRGVTD